MLQEFDVLAQHPLLDSADYTAVKTQVSRHLCAHAFDAPSDVPVRTRLNGLFFGGAALLDLRYHAPVRVGLDDVGNHYLFRLTLSGRCEVTHGDRRAAVQSGCISVTSPAARSTITTDGQCRNLILRVSRDALVGQLQRLVDRPLRDPLVFDLGLDAHHAGASNMVHALAYVCRVQSGGRQAPAMDASLAEFLMQQLLTQLPHNHTAAVQQEREAPLPRHVKLARDYIEAHLHEPITLPALSRACGVSARTLQNGFDRFLGRSPVAYIQEQRLAAVHRALSRGAPGTTVTEVLLDHGIQSAGHFTRAYRRRYGCLPSQTLRAGA